MKWTDTREIAILLEERFPEKDNLNLRFTDLHSWIVNLKEFNDNPEGSNEKILEAIQMAWIDERD
ncbi:MAG: Fe-S cluster assembly protein IscX [Pseudomonadota bacterium]|nr:Fe-S cluster assembly protein IscX [Pseudomonadota bacterium]